MSAFSPGTMGQLVACGPVEKQGWYWLAPGRQVLAPSLILSRTAHTQRFWGHILAAFPTWTFSLAWLPEERGPQLHTPRSRPP